MNRPDRIAWRVSDKDVRQAADSQAQALAAAMADDYPQEPEPVPTWWRRHGAEVAFAFAAGWIVALAFVAVFWRPHP